MFLLLCEKLQYQINGMAHVCCKHHCCPKCCLLNILQPSLCSTRPVRFVLYTTVTTTPATMYNDPNCLPVSLSLFILIHV